MADRGLIERVPGPGRAVRHRLTAQGARLRAEGQALVDAVLQASFQNLSAAELGQLGELLDKALSCDPIQPEPAVKRLVVADSLAGRVPEAGGSG